MRIKICERCKKEFISEKMGRPPKYCIQCSRIIKDKKDKERNKTDKHIETVRIRESKLEAREKLERTKRLRNVTGEGEESKSEGDFRTPPQSILSNRVIEKILSVPEQTLEDFGIKLTDEDREKLKNIESRSGKFYEFQKFYVPANHNRNPETNQRVNPNLQAVMERIERDKREWEKGVAEIRENERKAMYRKHLRWITGVANYV